MWLLTGRPGCDPETLEREHREWLAADAELHRRYPNAMFHERELAERAQAHGVRLSPFDSPHHRAALLDYLDDPARTEPLWNVSMAVSIAAINAQALDEHGEFTVSMIHPVNRARYKLIGYQFKRSGHQDEYYNDERAGWSLEQWLRYEQVDKEIRKFCSTIGTINWVEEHANHAYVRWRDPKTNIGCSRPFVFQPKHNPTRSPPSRQFQHESLML